MIAPLLFGALTVAAPASSASVLLFRAEVTTTQSRVFLKDVADVRLLPPSVGKLASQVEVARFEEGITAQDISTAEIARRVRSRAPIFGRWIARSASASPIRIRFLAPSESSTIVSARKMFSRTCLRTRHTLDVGVIVLPNDFDKIDCPAGYHFVRTFRRGADGGVRTVRAIAADDITPRFAGFDQDIIWPGQMMQMVSTAGSISVTRKVEALQSARQGRKLFVRDSDGVIFSLHNAGSEQ